MTTRRILLSLALLAAAAALLAHLAITAGTSALRERGADGLSRLHSTGRQIRSLHATIAKLQAPSAPAAIPDPTIARYFSARMAAIATHGQVRQWWLEQQLDEAKLRAQPILTALRYTPERITGYYHLVSMEEESRLDLIRAASEHGLASNDPLLAQQWAQLNASNARQEQQFFGSDYPTWTQQTAASDTVRVLLQESHDGTYSPAEQSQLRLAIAAHARGGDEHSGHDWDAIAVEAAGFLEASHRDGFSGAIQWVKLSEQKNALAKKGLPDR